MEVQQTKNNDEAPPAAAGKQPAAAPTSATASTTSATSPAADTGPPKKRAAPSSTDATSADPASSKRKSSVPSKKLSEYPPPKTKHKGSKKPKPSWNDMLFEYLQYEAKRKRSDATASTKGEPDHAAPPPMSLPLDAFLRQQRRQYAASLYRKRNNEPEPELLPDPWILTPERTDVLNHLDFQWKELSAVAQQYNKAWYEKYQELIEYKKIHGHTNVHQKDGDLGKWVKHQRTAKRTYDRLKESGQEDRSLLLNEERVKQLDAIGFYWRRRRDNIPNWEDRYEQLKKYKADHGDTLVPQTYPPDPGFGKWVMKQRSEYSQMKRGLKNTMYPERLELLEAIGFAWSKPKGPGVAAASAAGSKASSSPAKKKKRVVAPQVAVSPPPPQGILPPAMQQQYPYPPEPPGNRGAYNNNSLWF